MVLGLELDYTDTIPLVLNLSKGHNVSIQSGFKVLHLSTSHAGGAGIAALRLHQSLVAAGVNSHFLTLENNDFYPRTKEMVLPRSPFKKFKSKLTTKLSDNLFKNTYFTLFSTSVLTPSTLTKSGFGQDTVLHIHNWFNLISVRQLQRLLRNGYRMIITLHDQRFFSGGCHYSLNCDEYIKKCEKCPLLPNTSLQFVIRKNHKILYEIVTKYNNQIVFLAPSKWIQSEAERSSILKSSKILFQPNLHTEFETEFNQLKNSTGTDLLRNFSIGVASMDSSSPLKGSDFVPKIMDILGSENRTFQLKQLSQYPQTKEGYLSFWREINCLLVLSRADNSPNVIHEAKIAGVPIIGTNIGGIPELLNQSFDFVFDNDINLVRNVSQAIIEIEGKPPTFPQEIGARYKSSDSRGDIDGFLKIYSDFH